MRFLALDIGNTRTKVGVFENNQLVEQANWATGALDDMQAWMDNRFFEACIYSSVAEVQSTLPVLLRSKANFVFELTHETLLPFQNEYETPKTLGKDRLASVAGAQALCPNQTVLVVDSGTCIKYELLTADSRYLGGNIAPGLQMRLDAMQHFTARLPRPAMEWPKLPWGVSTTTALQNGGLLAAALEIEGFVRLFRKKHGSLHVLLSGGDAAVLKKHIPIRKMSLVPELVLLGLHHILLYNRKLVHAKI